MSYKSRLPYYLAELYLLGYIAEVYPILRHCWSIPYLITLPSPNWQVIRVEHEKSLNVVSKSQWSFASTKNAQVLSVWVEDPSGLSSLVDSLWLILTHKVFYPTTSSAHFSNTPIRHLLGLQEKRIFSKIVILLIS